METFRFSKRSKNSLAGLHPDLVWIAARGLVLSPMDFVVTEGLRSLERQKRLVAEGKSKTTRSMHLRQKDGWGHSFDVYALPTPGGSWDIEHYRPIAEAMYAAAQELGVKLTWGGEWGWDCPHFQLDTMDGLVRSTTERAAGLKTAAWT